MKLKNSLRPHMDRLGFHSFTALAARLFQRARHSKELPGTKQSLATYLCSLDKGQGAWFQRRPALLAELAAELGITDPLSLLPVASPIDRTGLMRTSVQAQSALYHQLADQGVCEGVALTLAETDLEQTLRILELEKRISELERRYEQAPV